uniref:Uncharacterized protein n=1 Tax=Streptomyces sp. FR1 TaxID=349971 RepID=V9Z4E4_9ACTN|nr:hypothetical protein pFRL3_77 [Streptomyces sp. FR1]
MSSFRLTRAVTEDATFAALRSHRALRRGREPAHGDLGQVPQGRRTDRTRRHGSPCP